jgi:hypothetical protein
MRGWRYIAVHTQYWNLIECSGRMHTATVLWLERASVPHRTGALVGSISGPDVCVENTKFLLHPRMPLCSTVTIQTNDCLLRCDAVQSCSCLRNVQGTVLAPYSCYKNLRTDDSLLYSELSLNIYQTARCHTPKHNNHNHLVYCFQVKFNHLMVKGKFNTITPWGRRWGVWI